MATVNLILRNDKLINQLKALEKQVRVSVQLQGVEICARFINRKAQDNAPRGLSSPGLASSDYVGQPKISGERAEVTFGFSAQHARVMNEGFRVKVIKPIRAKRLFIPLTRRAVRRGPQTGAVRALEGNRVSTLGPKSKGRRSPGASNELVFGQDFVLAKQVKTPPLRRGKKGPNRFFTRAYNRARRDGSLVGIVSRLVDNAIARTGKGNQAS